MAIPLRVLIVEDSEASLVLLQHELKRGGYEPAAERVDTQGAMSAALESGAWDIIISDYRMPHFDGLKALRLAKEKAPGLPFILVSGAFGEGVAVEAMKAGAGDYILKDDLARLVPAVRRELREAEVRREQRLAEERISHLNAVLRAVRNVNQLIVREKDRDLLIQQSCELLIETRGYHNAWIALLDESGKAVASAESGLGDAFAPMAERLERGDIPACGQRALSESAGVIIEDPVSECADCPLAVGYAGRAGMSVRLEHGGRAYGLLSVSTPRESLAVDEEPALLAEVAGDVGFALHGIEMEDDRRRAQERQAVTARILRTLNRSIDEVDVIRRILLLIKGFSRMEAVGIRLVDGDDYPYFESNGFPEDFIVAERYLCARDRHGELERDSDGVPVLECMCGNIIRGRFDPSLPFFTEGGSFWSNCTTELLATTSEEDRQARTRNLCNKRGYESVGLFPLRTRGGNIGLLQLNDRRKGMFSAGLLEFYESVAQSMGIALARKRAEEEVQRQTKFLGDAIEAVTHPFYVIDVNDYKVRLANSAARQAGSPDASTCHALSHNKDTPCGSAEHPCPLEEVTSTRGPVTVEHIHCGRDGETRHVEVHGYPILGADGTVVEMIEYCVDVTERKRAEEALRESEEKWRSLVQNAPAIIMTVGRDGTISFINHTVPGLTADQVVGKNVKYFVAPEHVDTAMSAIEGVFQTGDPTSYEVSGTGPGGGVAHYSTRIGPIMRDGKVVAAIQITTDITERRQADEKLRDAERKFNAFVQESAYGYLDTDLQGNITFCNARLLEIAGTSLAQAQRCGLMEFVVPEERERAAADLALALSEPNGGPREYTLQRRDGALVPIEVNTLAVKQSGVPVGFQMTIADISERRRAEERVESLARFPDEDPDPVIRVSRTGTVLYVNPAGASLVRPGGPESTAPLPEAITEAVRTAVSSQDPTHAEVRCGERLYSFVVAPVRNAAYVNLYGRDITEHRELEEQFRQSQKLEAVGRLAGGVAHDFNNMLGAIMGYSDVILTSLEEADPIRRDIEQIKSAADRAAALTRQLLAFSRKQTLQPKVIELNAAVTSLEKMLRRLIGEDVELATVLADDLGRVKVDPGQVDQVIMNLAVNSRDAMPGGGKLTVETANVELDEEYAKTHVAVTPGPHVMLAVTDTGCGMDEETRSHIFEPFFTTKEMGKGTGLGLSMVYGIVKQSGGNIWVYSEPGKGTTFKVYLPRVEKGVETAERPRPVAARAKGSETILVVEDEEVLRRLITRILSLSGYKVLEARNGGEALLLCERHDGPIHLMVTDVVMPQMGGRQLAERVASLRPEMKVAYMSGYTDDAIVRNGELPADVLFVQKPFTASTLARTVREALDSPGTGTNNDGQDTQDDDG